MSGEAIQQSEALSAARAKHLAILRFCNNKPAGIALSTLVMLALTLIVNVSGLPNPNMILVTGLVACATVFGYPGGIVAAIIMMAYTLAFFSTGHDFATFTDENMKKVIVSAVGVVVITLFVSTLRLILARIFLKLEQLNEVLEEDNKLLEAATATDTLTSTRNRFGLRRDFDGYVGKDVHVLMLDIDDFKSLNDSLGHQVGDYALSQVGRCLTDLCDRDHVYRYGGDEFLVICPDESPQTFERRLRELRERIAETELEGTDEQVHFSGGFTYGKPAIPSDLRLMIRQADANLYESKRAGKDQVRGCAFSRLQAQALDQSAASASGRITARQ